MKYIISFIVVIFLIALLIRACDNNPIEYNKDLDQVSSDTLIASIVKDYDPIEVLEEDIEIDTLDLEIPRLVVPKPEQLLSRIGYKTSYNSTTKNANWVAWHLSKEHTEGPYKRKGIPYIEDDEIIGAKQELSDWSSHGNYDHGHLCPAGDNKWSKEAMLQTFLLSNMSPQDKDLNNGLWERLESRTRGWAKHYGRIYIVTGPIFYNNGYSTMGVNEVGIPDAFFKVLLVIEPKPKAIGFIMPNKKTEYNKIDYYAVSVDSVEKVTGIDFFHKLPDRIENEVEANYDFSKW